MIGSLKDCLQLRGISLRVKRLGNFKYYLGSKVYTLKVSNGAVVAHMGGGYSSIVDVLGSLSPTAISEKPTCKEANVQKPLIHRDQPPAQPLLTLPSPSA
ncbi:hypothetical protein CYMTET_25541 [Cymbomonas tetramitiformis]|nr:hypothetical protein CYMTET_25541 [Cymbomonas tetramitiformis]